MRSTAGMGHGPCYGAIGGQCLDVLSPNIMGPVTANASGVATLSATLPATVPAGTNVCLQAWAIRGPGGADTVRSPVTCRVSNNGPVDLVGGANTGLDFSDGTSMGGPNLYYAMRHDVGAPGVVGYVEVFTGERAGMNTVSIWSHDPVDNEPETMLASGSWMQTDSNEWQGASLGARVVMGQGETYWVVWQPQNGAQSTRQATGGGVSYRGSFDAGASWNGPFSQPEKYKLCGGGGCP